MSKKINLGTINAQSLDSLSKYHVAHVELKALREIYKAESAKITEKMEKIRENRKADIDAGIPADTVIAKWSLEECYSEQAKLDAQYETDCKPHKEARKEAMSLLPDYLYHSYVLAMRKGDMGATGKLSMKQGKKEVEYTLENTFKQNVRVFLESIGCDASNDTALNKFAQVMSVRTAGMRKNNKGEDFISEKSASQFNDLFMLAFLQYTIREKGVITINEDNTLSMTVYED